jgi:molybdate transport system substrate-binding protein
MRRSPIRLADALRAALVLLGVALALPAAAAERLTVFAAASTTDAMAEILQRFEAETGVPAVASFASSSTLAKQIARGAPADIYVSANVRWMDYLENAGAIQADSRVDLLGNALVLVTARGSGFDCDPGAGCDLAAALGDGRLAVGDPDHVPAGLYAKQALIRLGQWPELEPNLARASDVRGALALVTRGETPAGIVYATDAALHEDVETVATLPADSHDPIVYPAARVADSDRPQAAALLRYLAGPQARDVFARYGFTVVAPPPPQG